MATLGEFYRQCGIPKPEPRCLTKKRQHKMDAKNERAAREITRKRDNGRCRIPNCHERATELHHIVARSQSRRKRWDTANLVWLCRDHHQLRHAGEIAIAGNADEEIIVTGNIDLLKFRL
jgi:5-methylcytosine-specific restriction endonuclease McrA